MGCAGRYNRFPLNTVISGGGGGGVDSSGAPIFSSGDRIKMKQLFGNRLTVREDE